MFANHLSYAQRRSLSNSLVWVTALTAVLTVAAPTLLPCPVAHGKGHILGDEAELDGDADADEGHTGNDAKVLHPRGTVACLAAAGGNWCPMSVFGNVRRTSMTRSRDDMPKVCVAWPKSSRTSSCDAMLPVAGSTTTAMCLEELVVR